MKKTLLTILAMVMVAAISITGTLAYLTSTDKADNVFTVGNVKIKLNEKQRGEDGKLVDFVQNKTLLPIVGSAQGTKDDNYLPVAENYVDKIATVTNTGSQEAWVRAYFAIPSELDDGYETFNAGMNTLHFNFGVNAAEKRTTEGYEWTWKVDGKWNYYETVINGVNYNVYYADYATRLAAGATTEQFVSGVYLDKNVNYVVNAEDTTKYDMVVGDKVIMSKIDPSNLKITCPVFAVAVQAAGFNNANEAVANAFGNQYNPWGGVATNWQQPDVALVK